MAENLIKTLENLIAQRYSNLKALWELYRQACEALESEEFVASRHNRLLQCGKALARRNS